MTLASPPSLATAAAATAATKCTSEIAVTAAYTALRSLKYAVRNTLNMQQPQEK